MKLFTPITINGIELRNRVTMLPMVMHHGTEQGFVTEAVVQHYAERARGVGLVVVEGTGVLDRRSGRLLKLYDDTFVPGLRQVADVIHHGGATATIQLVHFLRVAPRTGWRESPADLSLQDVEQVIEDFARASVRAREAGFEGVELHMAHGYSLASFLSTAGNNRTDHYGRSLEGRLRLPTRVYERVRAELGCDALVGCRINADDFVLGGNTLKQSRLIARHFDQLGIDYISVSVGGRPEDWQKNGGYSWTRAMPTDRMPDAVNVYLAADLRRHVKAPVLVAGKIPTPQLAERILQDGDADLIGIARPLLSDPDWAIKAHAGRSKEIRRCTYCYKCCVLEHNFEQVYCVTWSERDQRRANR